MNDIFKSNLLQIITVMAVFPAMERRSFHSLRLFTTANCRTARGCFHFRKQNKLDYRLAKGKNAPVVHHSPM